MQESSNYPHYPKDLFEKTHDGSPRPYIIFTGMKPKFDITSLSSYKDIGSGSKVVGGFALPIPNGDLTDAVTHDFGPQVNPIMSGLIGSISDSTVTKASYLTGLVPDPQMVNIYKGTTPRTWSGTWQIIPQSEEEAKTVTKILKFIKKWGSPDFKGAEVKNIKLGTLVQPLNYKIYFSNPLVNGLMNFKEMTLTNYSINLNAQGYASSYHDMMPKQIELSLSFGENGIRYNKDWKI